jgi:hypothetical protein
MRLDDKEFWRGPITRTYSVWYAPAVRHVVREERDADYIEKSVGNGYSKSAIAHPAAADNVKACSRG